jgi:hypothetical protein
VNGAGLMHRLLQSLCERVGFSRAETSGRGASHTVRTEVTVERKETTVLVGGVTSGAFDTCPLCGQELAPAPAALVRDRLVSRPGSQTAPSG